MNESSAYWLACRAHHRSMFPSSKSIMNARTVNLHLKMISKEASANLICKYLMWIVRGIVRRTQLLNRQCQCDTHRRGGRVGGGPNVRPLFRSENDWSLTNFNIDYLICETRVMELCSLFLFCFSFSGELCGWEEIQERRQVGGDSLNFELTLWRSRFLAWLLCIVKHIWINSIAIQW